MNYHASGIKVGENASWVGAGWALNAGGVITRTVRGLPDEKGTLNQFQTRGHFSDYGYNNYPEIFIPNAGSPYGKMFDVTGFAKQYYDGEPDLFTFNFNGYSGKFYFRDDRTPVIVPESDIKIEYDYREGQLDTLQRTEGIRAFIITTPDGVKYYFGKKPTDLGNEQVEITNVGTPTSNPYNSAGTSNVISSWYLYKMVSPDQQFSINLSYAYDSYSYYQIAPHDLPGSPSLSPNGVEYSLIKMFVSGVKLTSIRFSNGRVDFIPGAARDDLSAYQASPYMNDIPNSTATAPTTTLGGISIKNAQLEELKKYNFTYDYFSDQVSALPGHIGTDDAGFNITSDRKKLKLLSVQEFSASGVSNPPYSFSYFSEQVPRSLSFGQDHWGFINGVNNNSQLISTYTLQGTTIAGADRESHFPAMRAGALNKITYPTGGYDQLDYEPNLYWVSTTNANVPVGGLRIKTITKSYGGSSPNNVTNYDYTSYDHIASSAILYSKPVIVQIVRNDIFQKVQLPGWNTNGCLVADNSTNIGYIVSPSTTRPMATAQGSPIGYSIVKVSQTGNGYTQYRYFGDDPYNASTDPNIISHDDVAVRNLASYSICDPKVPNYPAAPLPFEYKRGELQHEGHFNESGIELQTTDYSQPAYTQDPISTPAIIVSIAITNTVPYVITNYNLATARKTHQQITETVFDSNGLNGVVTTKDMYWGSNYHHQLTQQVVTNSKGETLTTNYSFPQDFRVAAADALDNGLATYISSMDQAQNNWDSNNGACYSTSPMPTGCTTYAYNYLWYQQGQARAAFVNSLKLASPVAPTTISPVNCYNYVLNATFSTDYQWLDQANVSHTLHVEANTSPSVCAQDNSVTGGPATKGAICFTGVPNFKYLFDQARLHADNLLKPLLDLQLLNIFTPIEVTTMRNTAVTSGSFSLYDFANYPFFGYYPNKSQKLDVISPITNFTNSGVSSNGTSVTKDSRYKDRLVLGHTNGNLTEMSMAEGPVSAYLWDYNNQFPVAKVSNAAYSNVAFTSFEANGGGRWTISGATSPDNNAITGQKDYLLSNGNVSCSGLNTAKTYVVSYWSKNGAQSVNGSATAIAGSTYGGWTYYEHSIANPAGGTITVSGSGTIDELRLYPVDAQMTSYTYDPIVGMTSSTDAKGQITYYEYDSFQRLVNIKNKDGNIVKHIDYHYQQ